MLLPAFPPADTTLNQLTKNKIQSQIRRKTSDADLIRQKIVMLQKELRDTDSVVASLRMRLIRGSKKRTGIFCEVQKRLNYFGGTKLVVMCSRFFATGMVCLTSCTENLEFGKQGDGIKLWNLMYRSASLHILDGRRQEGNCTNTSVASLSISLQVCLESIESASIRSVNSSSQDTYDSASSAEDQDRKDNEAFGFPVFANEVTKSTIASTSTRSSVRRFRSASPMQAESPWSPFHTRSMDVMDLGPAASSTTPGSVTSSQSYRIKQSSKLNKRRDSAIVKKPRLISFWDDYPSAATDDSSCVRSKSRRRSRDGTESPKLRSFPLPGESQGVENEYFRSIEANDVARVKSLLDLGVTMECRNAQSNTGLILAAMKGFCEIVNCFLNAGAAGHVNLSNDDGFTALQYAAKLGDKDIVLCLLNHRADVDAKNKFHQTPVMLSARNGHSDVTGMLVEAGASIERTDKGGRNALMMAARNGRVATIETLLKAKASVNMVDRRGKTALTLLAEHACPRSIRGMKLLLDYGAHARADDDDGLCALTYLGRRVKAGLVPLNSDVRSIAERMKGSMQ
jgi:ankyrin repeat protein